VVERYKTSPLGVRSPGPYCLPILMDLRKIAVMDAELHGGAEHR
jgi:hypothetical protein